MNYLLPADTQEVNLLTEVVIRDVLKERIIKEPKELKELKEKEELKELKEHRISENN